MPRSDALFTWSPARMPRPPGIDRQRLVQSELGREIGHRPRPEHAGVPRAPRVVSSCQIFLQPAVGVVDPAVEHRAARRVLRAPRRAVCRRSAIGLWSELAPERWIELAEQAVSIRRPSSTTGSLPARADAGAPARRIAAAFALPPRSTRPELPAVVSSRTMCSSNPRGSTVCTTRTPWSNPRSMMGTPRNE